jgi:DNA-binding Lrp family transcriptional regulator
VPNTWELLLLADYLNMPDKDYKLLTILQVSCWVDGFCYPSINSLTVKMGPRCSKSTVQRILKKAKERGIIKKRRQGGSNRRGNGTNKYWFTFKDEEGWPKKVEDAAPYPVKSRIWSYM